MLFDASSLLTLVREVRGKATDILLDNSTISLAYYEVGNALWKECFLLKRIVPKEAAKLLRSIFAFIDEMDVIVVEDEELGSAILDIAGKQKITYYDAAYLMGAKKSNKMLVTDDNKLARVAEREGVKPLSSKTVYEYQSRS